MDVIDLLTKDHIALRTFQLSSKLTAVAPIRQQANYTHSFEESMTIGQISVTDESSSFLRGVHITYLKSLVRFLNLKVVELSPSTHANVNDR